TGAWVDAACAAADAALHIIGPANTKRARHARPSACRAAGRSPRRSGFPASGNDDQLALHQRGMAGEGAEEGVVAAGLELAARERGLGAGAAADHVGGTQDL